MQHIERELLEPVMLCDRKGQLNPAAIGFSRKPLIQSNLKRNFLKKKQWNYWCIYGEEILFSALICNLDYATVCNVYLLNYETQYFFEKQLIIPMGKNVAMPEEVLQSVHYKSKALTIQFSYEGSSTLMTIQIADFDGDPLYANLRIEHPPEDDSLQVVIPRNRSVFQLTAKHHTLPTTGIVQLGSSLYEFHSEHSFAVLDYSRGIWPRKAHWNWGLASQRVGNQRIGLNFGGKWTDGTGMTENALFIDGQLFKIHEDVIFTYNDNNFMEEWKIQTKFSDTVDLRFKPFFQRTMNSDLKLFTKTAHQAVGYFHGVIRLPNNQLLTIRQMLGTCEEHHAKW